MTLLTLMSMVRQGSVIDFSVPNSNYIHVHQDVTIFEFSSILNSIYKRGLSKRNIFHECQISYCYMELNCK